MATPDSERDPAPDSEPDPTPDPEPGPGPDPEPDLEPAPLPPRWMMVMSWRAHRLLVKVTRTRRGLVSPEQAPYGLARLHTVGRRTGRRHAVIVAYYEDDAGLVVLAMNGWAEPLPAWWLNLREQPDAVVDLVGGSRKVHAREAHGEERVRLWAGWREHSEEDLDAFAALRSRKTPVIVLEPVD